MSTSKEIAKLAGVSVATVSRVYLYPDRVRPETKELVLKAAQELNYYPNLSARNLKLNRSNSIGMVINDFSNPFFFQVIEKINNKLNGTDYQLLTFSSYGNSFSNEKLIRYLISNQLDAFVFSPYSFVKKDQQFFTNIKQYCLQLFEDYYDELDSLTIDDFYGVYVAVKYLLEQGHRKILVLNVKTNNKSIRDYGYQKAYSDFGLSPDPNYLCYYSTSLNQSKAIEEKIRQLKPTAVISHAETLSIWTLTALQALHLNFPKDISLILYDDHPWAEVMGISAIAQPLTLVGNTIASMLLDALATAPPRATTKRKIKPELILRNSVRKISLK